MKRRTGMRPQRSSDRYEGRSTGDSTDAQSEPFISTWVIRGDTKVPGATLAWLCGTSHNTNTAQRHQRAVHDRGPLSARALLATPLSGRGVMQPEIASTQAECASASDQLDAALLDAMSRKRTTRHLALRKLLAPGEFVTLREAVARYVMVSKAQQASPERALIQLKNRLALSARALGREPLEVVSATVLDAFLRSYYDEARSSR